jgi:hypothetical protein
MTPNEEHPAQAHEAMPKAEPENVDDRLIILAVFNAYT